MTRSVDGITTAKFDVTASFGVKTGRMTFTEVDASTLGAREVVPSQMETRNPKPEIRNSPETRVPKP